MFIELCKINKLVMHLNSCSMDLGRDKISLIDFIFKNKLRQFSKLILPHIFLVMAKSHSTCTIVSRVTKSMRIVCETFARSKSVSLYEE